MRNVFAVCLLVLFASVVSAKGVYLTSAEFLERSFGDEVPKIQAIWIKGELKKDVQEISQGSLRKLRVKYWGKDDRTAWILEEIGKELPITIGVVVANNQIQRLDILAFRESRGGEVRYPFFTDQFSLLKLQDDHRLSQPVDGITGATLSVRAVKKAARLALYLHSHTTYSTPPATTLAKH